MKNSQQGRHLATPVPSPRRESPRPAERRVQKEQPSKVQQVRRERSSALEKPVRKARLQPDAPLSKTEDRAIEAAVPSADRRKKTSVRGRPLLIACYICLLLCFLFGAAEVLLFQEARPSETENRMLQGFPELNSDSLLSGKFMEEMESYLSDAFFFRDEAASFTEKQLSVFAVPNDGPDTWDVDAEHLDAPVTDSENPVAEEQLIESVPPKEEDTEPQELETLSESEPTVAPAVTVDTSLLSEVEFYLLDKDGKKSNIYAFSVDQLAAFAQILNDYRDALPEDGTLHFVIPPVSYVANNILVKGTYTGWGSNLEDVLQPVVSDGVYVYDVADILTPYLETERLYPVNDHHWQPFSASKVAETMIRSQGLPAMDFYEYRYYVSLLSNAKPFYGDALRSLSLPADTVPVMEPVCPVNAYKIKNFTQRSPDVFIDKSKGGLMSYMGGMQPGPWRYFESGFHTGRKALLVTDSFGLTLAPFLVPYYDEILFVDLRESLFSLEASGGTIREYIEYFGIDDIYMISSAYNPTIVEQVQARLFRYLG